MLVTIERMEALVAVVETGSFSAAARRLEKTPSAISRIIQHFELDLGVDLFQRREGQAPRATATARNLYQQAVEILPRLEILENKASDCLQGVESRLVLAIHGLAFNDLVERALKRFVTEFPGVDLTLLDPESLAIDRALIDGEVDLVFIPATILPTRAVSFHRYAVAEWCLVAAAAHPLARLRGELTEADLLPHTQLLPAEGPLFDRTLLESMRICPRQINCQRLVQLLELLMSGMGFAYLPRFAVDLYLHSGHLCELNYESAQQGLKVWDMEVRWASVGPAAQWLLDAVREPS